jgi:hypothetical protein
MDDLGRLLAGIAAPSESRTLGSILERGLVYGLVFGVLALACAFTVVGFLALAVYSAALPDFGAVRAAFLAALAAAVLMAILVFALRRTLQPESRPADRPSPRASPLAAAAQSPPPKTMWDLVTLVAAGVLAGLAQKR